MPLLGLNPTYGRTFFESQIGTPTPKVAAFAGKLTPPNYSYSFKMIRHTYCTMRQQRSSSLLLSLCLLLVAPSPSLLFLAFGYDNGLGLTPPMGWNSWNAFHCEAELRETVVQDIAHAMVDLGLADLGYEYVNLDDCWQSMLRNVTTGTVIEDRHRFPSGMAALSAYVHDLGLKFGLYSDAGMTTCAGRPGGLGYEEKDAAIYKTWKVDYLKYDNCFNLGMNVHKRYQRMHDALNATGHPIFFSLCEWGQDHVAMWGREMGNSWRTGMDIEPHFDAIVSIADENNKWHQYAGPGGFNDPDMLEIGNGDLTLDEQRTHFTLWCLMKAPLLLGNDLRSMAPETLEIVSNKELIAWNQDKLGLQGYKRRIVSPNTELEVWAGNLEKDKVALVLLNRSDQPQAITALWEDFGMNDPNFAFHVRDVWAHEDLPGVYTQSIVRSVVGHGVAALELTPEREEEDSIEFQQIA